MLLTDLLFGIGYSIYVQKWFAVSRALKYSFLHTLWSFILGAGLGEVEVTIQDPNGRKDTADVQLEDKGSSTYRCTYKPTLEGVYTIYITFAGMQIPKSPYTVTIGQGENCCLQDISLSSP